MLVLGKPFQPCLMFVGKAKSLLQRELLLGAPLGKARSLSLKHYIRLESLISAKHSRLLRTFVNYRHNIFYNIEPRPQGPLLQNFCREFSPQFFSEQNALKDINNCLNTNIYSYSETSDGQSSYPYLYVVHFFNTRVD